MRPRVRYALIGVLLGLGAPVGSLALRMLFLWQGDVFQYLYMTVGTTVAFGLFGYALGRKNETLGEMSIRDGLTDLYNHRYLQEVLGHEIERSDRHASPISCLMLDVDDFKHVNDQYGHPFGDVVLKEIATLIHDAVRRIDIVGRYGGEEFLVIMPQTNTLVALPIAERIVAAVQNHHFVFKGKIEVRTTISAGLATYPLPDHGVKSRSSLISAADQALYKAKLAGKNRVQVCGLT